MKLVVDSSDHKPDFMPQSREREKGRLALSDGGLLLLRSSAWILPGCGIRASASRRLASACTAGLDSQTPQVWSRSIFNVSLCEGRMRRLSITSSRRRFWLCQNHNLASPGVPIKRFRSSESSPGATRPVLLRPHETPNFARPDSGVDKNPGLDTTFVPEFFPSHGILKACRLRSTGATFCRWIFSAIASTEGRQRRPHRPSLTQT